MRQNRKYAVVAALLALAMVGCAVQRSQAPQISPATTWELNTADQLSQLERDYRTVFTDVGNWQRAGQITPTQVATLNEIGHRLKPALESANRIFKTWQQTRDGSLRDQVIAAVLAATNIFTELATTKAKIAVGGK